MLNQDEINQQLEQLAAHRRTLAVLLRQRADLGASYAPPGVHNGIAEARREIARLKATMRAAGVAVEDSPNDEDVHKDQLTNPIALQSTKQMIFLRQMLIRHFNDSELRDLCFDLHVDYESLPGQGKADKARELVAYMERYGRTAEIVSHCHILRPDVDWQNVAPPTSAQQSAPQQSNPLPYRQSTANKLNSNQRKWLFEALLDALLIPDGLEMMLFVEMSVDLVDIVPADEDPRKIIFKLIQWAETEKRVEELVRAARKENSNNSKLYNIAQDILGPNA